MKGETAELCRLTAHAKYALKHGNGLYYTPGKYVLSEGFTFLPRKMSVLPIKKEISEKTADDWFKRLLSFGIADIYMLLPVNYGNRTIHGFANANSGCVLCLWNSGAVTFFSPKWSFNNDRRAWNIEYTEREWNDPPNEPPHFSDNAAEFSNALADIAELADKIDEKYWASIFRKAKDTLNGKLAHEQTGLPDLPEKNLRLYSAAAQADVFGAMGSWNDSPPWSAEQKGLSDDYTRMSNELFLQIQKALMFAVNEF